MKNLRVYILGTVLAVFIVSSIGCDEKKSDPVGLWRLKSETVYTKDTQKTTNFPRVNVNNEDIDEDGELEYFASHNYIEVKLDRLVVAIQAELSDPGEPSNLTAKDGEVKPVFIGTNEIKDGKLITTFLEGEQTVGMIFQYILSDETLILISIGLPDQKVKYVLEKVKESEMISDAIESGIELICEEQNLYCEYLSEDIIE